MRSLLPIVVLLVALTSPIAVAGEQETNLGQPNPEWKRLKAAEKLTKSGDLDAIFRAVMVTAERADEEDVKILVALVLREENPLLRLLYGRGLEKIGREKATPALSEKIQTAKLADKVRGIEILGYLRDPAAIPTLLALGADKDRHVATEAFRGLARVVPKKEIKPLVAAAAAAQTRGARITGAWAVADVYRSAKGAAGAFRKVSRGDTMQAEWAKRLISDLTGEGIDTVFRYPKPPHLIGVEQFFGSDRPAIVVNGDLLSKENMQKALDHLKEKAPDYYQFVTRVFRKIDNKRSSQIASPIVWNTRALSFQRGEAKSWNPEILSYMMVRAGSRLLLRDCGDIHKGRRGLSKAAVNAYWYCRRHTLVDTRRDMGEFIDHLVKQKLWKE